MFITRKRYEAELEKARCEGAEKVWKQVSFDQENERIHQRLNRLEDMIRKVSHPIPDNGKEVLPSA